MCILTVVGEPDGRGSDSVPESSRVRSRLEGVRPQGANDVTEMQYSTPDSPLTPHGMQQKLQQE